MSERARELRELFDRGFADALVDKPTTFDYLRLRVAGAPYAVALSEVTSLHVDLRIASMPSPARELLGIAAVRTSLVPIYDLRLAIGASDELAPRWTILVAAGTAGFAFDGFDGHARTTTRVVDASQLIALGDHSYPLITTTSLLETIQRRWMKEPR
jgi:chemotaxis signal transduction protein